MNKILEGLKVARRPAYTGLNRVCRRGEVHRIVFFENYWGGKGAQMASVFRFWRLWLVVCLLIHLLTCSPNNSLTHFLIPPPTCSVTNCHVDLFAHQLPDSLITHLVTYSLTPAHILTLCHLAMNQWIFQVVNCHVVAFIAWRWILPAVNFPFGELLAMKFQSTVIQRFQYQLTTMSSMLRWHVVGICVKFGSTNSIFQVSSETCRCCSASKVSFSGFLSLDTIIRAIPLWTPPLSKSWTMHSLWELLLTLFSLSSRVTLLISVRNKN